MVPSRYFLVGLVVLLAACQVDYLDRAENICEKYCGGELIQYEAEPFGTSYTCTKGNTLESYDSLKTNVVCVDDTDGFTTEHVEVREFHCSPCPGGTE